MSVSVALGGGADDAIPREYHRRVLKKIAQLTKVVYGLNTRNEEHESFIAALRSTYEERARQSESSAAAQLREMGERVSSACEDGERRVEEVRSKLEEEREQLTQMQASYKKEAEEKLKAVEHEHRQKLENLVKELEAVSVQQARQVKDIVQLREQAKDALDQREKELADRHEREMTAAAEETARQVERCRSEAASAKTEMDREMVVLRERHRLELEDLKSSLRGEEKERGAAELRRWEEKERTLREQLEQKEQSLARRVSDLSEELRTTRDQLAVARQRVVEMSELLETQQDEVRGLQCQLEAGCREREVLKEQLASLHASLESAEEEGRTWRGMLSEKAETTERLEVGYRQTVNELQSQLSALQERAREMEREREAQTIQHHSSMQQHSHSLSSMEKELSRLLKERDDLHSQYAREIEAAQAHTGVREVELSTQHSSQLREMRQQHERALLELRTAHQQSLEQLRCDLSSASELERQSLCSRHQGEVGSLRRELEEKEAQLAKLASELADVLRAVDERRHGMGVVESEVERLKVEGREMTEKETVARRETEQLKGSLKQLRSEVVKGKERHKRELTELRISVQRDTQTECTENMNRELEAMRREMSAGHIQSTQQALAALAQEKDDALSEARHVWEKEQNNLREKIILLERRAVAIQQSNCLSLEEGRKQAEKQIMSLREALESERRSCAGHIEDLGRAHCEEVERVRGEERERRREEVEKLSEEWHRDTQRRETKYCEEVRLVREEGEREKREMMRREQDTHRQEMASLQNALVEQHRSEVKRLQGEWEKERQAWAQNRQQLDNQRDIEVSGYIRHMEEMKEEGERRNRDLSSTRDSLSSATEECALLRKELEVRVQEIEATKRMASNVLRCREQELTSAHHAEVESLSSQYRQQTQLLLSDFNKAKKMMTTKIAQLQIQVSELDSLYHSREPRPEDVETIRELQKEVRLYQTRLKEMEAEKQVYQLELVNREKNYNQIFGASPCVGVLNPLSTSKACVGVLNPLSTSKKNGSKPPVEPLSSSRHSSAPSLSAERSRLPALVSSKSVVSRLTASDAELGRRGSPPAQRPHPHQTVSQSPLTRRKLTSTRDTVY